MDNKSVFVVLPHQVGFMPQSSTNTTLFMLYLVDHFKRYGVSLEQLVIQTDNGTEFTMPWNTSNIGIH